MIWNGESQYLSGLEITARFKLDWNLDRNSPIGRHQDFADVCRGETHNQGWMAITIGNGERPFYSA